MSISHQGFCGYYEILVSSPAIVVIVSHLLYCSNSDLYCLRPSTLVKCTLTTCFNLHIPHLALYICLSLCFLFFMAFLLPALLSIVKVLSSCSTWSVFPFHHKGVVRKTTYITMCSILHVIQKLDWLSTCTSLQVWWHSSRACSSIPALWQHHDSKNCLAVQYLHSKQRNMYTLSQRVSYKEEYGKISPASLPGLHHLQYEIPSNLYCKWQTPWNPAMRLGSLSTYCIVKNYYYIVGYSQKTSSLSFIPGILYVNEILLDTVCLFSAEYRPMITMGANSNQTC